MNDSFYTPKILADKLLSYVSTDQIFDNVVDFCVGDGELLRAAENRWPNIQCYGSDISELSVQVTRARHKNWMISKFDFLDKDKSVSNFEMLNLKNQFDLILLNPPFSCRAGTIYYSVIDDQQFTTSTSMKFVLEALNFLSPSGVMYAILPLSVAYSQKDRKAWSFLVQKYNLTILEETNTKYFKDCDPNILLVSLNDFKQTNNKQYQNRSNAHFFGINVFRGKLSMHKIEKYSGDYYLVHTTNLKSNKIQNLNIKVNHEPSLIHGPAVLLPRVGKPDFSKICIIKTDELFCISDCIIALKCGSDQIAISLFSFLANNWDVFSSFYRGTGAHYITKEKVEHYLNLDIVTEEQAALVCQ